MAAHERRQNGVGYHIMHSVPFKKINQRAPAGIEAILSCPLRLKTSNAFFAHQDLISRRQMRRGYGSKSNSNCTCTVAAKKRSEISAPRHRERTN
jgi:hypothetical protein